MTLMSVCERLDRDLDAARDEDLRRRNSVGDEKSLVEMMVADDAQHCPLDHGDRDDDQDLLR